MGRARQLEESYEMPLRSNRYFLAGDKTSLEISIHNFEPYGYEEAQELIEKEREEKAKKLALKSVGQ